ncbi:uncharacterized protein G2W53_003942 [Senna tora]|uniref:Uncharacterized protein n=1 Tax=Senna tora TaxID=362788 RepID=A0A834XB10_9FABA|nr:uncharacterized protein G2W53_003942 [Senna tora]
MGHFPYINTAPRPIPEASVSRLNG